MDQWLAIAEKFGISVVMLIGVSWGMVKLFQWMAHTMMKQISLNQERTESINIKLIDAINQLRAEIKELKVKLEGNTVGQGTIIDVISSLTGNGLKGKHDR
tara:strand:- start:256 stop:558 length:303 start_codon:yes stop_codon:yes gene_type:complete